MKRYNSLHDHIFKPLNHSVLKFFTGFALEAFHACDKTISKLIAANANTSAMSSNGEMLIRDAKNCNHKLFTIYATGTAMITAIPNRIMYPFDNNVITWNTFEPSTLRTLISFLRVSAVYVAIPRSPRHEMSTASNASTLKTPAVSLSIACVTDNCSSKNSYQNLLEGFTIFHVFCRNATVPCTSLPLIRTVA